MASATAPNITAAQLVEPPRSNYRPPSSKLFSLALVDLQDDPGIPSTLDDLAFREFVFPYNPGQLTRETVPAVQITATPGGMIREHSGALFKNYHVSGTFGLRPERGRQVQPSVLGIPTPDFFGGGLALDEETGLPEGEKTGFDYTNDLLNLEATYYAAMEDPKLAHRIVLVWQDGLLGEFYVAEFMPPGIRTELGGRNRLHRQFSFSLQTMRRLDLLLAELQDRNPTQPGGFFGFLRRLTDAVRKLQQAFNFITAVIDRVGNIARRTIGAFTSIFSTVLNGIRAVVQAGGRLISIPRETITRLAREVRDFARDLEQTIRDVKQEWTLTRRAVTTSFAGRPDWSRGAQIDTARALVHVCHNTVATLARVAAEDRLFRSSRNQIGERGRRAYAGSSNERNLPSSVQARSSSVVARQSWVQSGDTPERIAQRLLGDSARAGEIIDLNRLSYPYISAAGDGISVLRPEDPILYPSPRALPQDVPVGADYRSGRAAADLEERLGIDVRFVQQSDGTYDYALSSTGDMALVAGYENMEQAVRSKFLTPRGTLLGHPLYGDVPVVGKKLSRPIQIQSIAQAHLFTRAALLRDPRISGVRNLEVRLSGNTLERTGEIDLAGGDAALSFRSPQP